MKNGLCVILTLAFCLFFATGATAGIAYDTSLASGVYFGSGNQNEHFTVFTSADGALELGLAVVDRYIGNVTPTTTNNYDVLAGTTTAPGRSGPIWGLTYSVKTTGSLSDYIFILQVQDPDDPGTYSLVFDPSTLPDNATVSGGFQNSLPGAFNVDQFAVSLVAMSRTPGVLAGQVNINIDAAPTPEPATLGLIGSALIGLSLVGSRRLRRSK